MQHETSRQREGAASSPPPSTLQFQDSKGRSWRVYERTRIGYDRRSVRMLMFESDVAVRCVRSYPEDWPSLSPEALEQLSWQT